MPTYLYIYNFTLTNELNIIHDRLDWGASSLDAAISEINNIAIMTSRDSRFRIFGQDRHLIQSNPLLLNELRWHFNSLLFSHPLIANGGIIFSRDLILTRQEIFYLPDLLPFYGNYIYCADLSEEEWFSLIAEINTLSPAMVFSSMDHGPSLGLSYSVTWGIPGSPGIVYAVMPANSIISSLAEDAVLSQSYIRIFDNNDNTLHFYSGEKWNPQGPFRTLSGRSEVIPVFFEIMVPESVISGMMTQVRNLMFAFALITIFLVICFSLFFAYKWSEPMRSFLSSIDSTKILKNEYEQNIGQAEFSLKNYFSRVYTGLSKSISDVDNRLEDSLKTIESQASLLKEQLFFKALYQGIYIEQDEQIFYSLFSDFPDLFQLASISFDGPENSSLSESAAIQLQLINAVKSQIGNLFIHSAGKNIIIILLPISERNESWYARLKELRNNLNQQIDLTLHFSLSSVYGKPAELPRAWQELQSIRINPGIENLVSVVQIKDIPNHGNRSPVDISTLQLIYNALSNGNDSMACQILAESIQDLNGAGFILGLFSNMLHDMLLLLKTGNAGLLINEEIPQYIQGREEELLNREYPEYFRRIGHLIRQNKEENISHFGSQILNFINENIYNPDLYSTMVLDHFNISQPTLQKLIKEVSGHTYLSYVESCRMTRAMELLTEGIYTIQEVSVKCGFSSTNSFYKAFRRKYGFPPSDINSRLKKA